MIKKMMTAPCSLNTEPYLTEWYADLESGMEIWIQTSEDESNPKWVRLGNLFERCWKNEDCENHFSKINGSDHRVEVSVYHLVMCPKDCI